MALTLYSTSRHTVISIKTYYENNQTRYISQERLFVFANKAKNVQEMSEKDNLILGSGKCMCENQK
jgi:hypothetical protein